MTRQRQNPNFSGAFALFHILAFAAGVYAGSFEERIIFPAVPAVHGGALGARNGFVPRSRRALARPMVEPLWRSINRRNVPGLFQRQADSEAYCNEGTHVCRDLKAGIAGCCYNNTYCIIGGDGSGLCCPLGEKCNNDPCGTASILCTATVTPTSTVTVGSSSLSEITLDPTIATQCCPRPCSTTAHLCDSQFGGNCCNNDAICLISDKCQPTPNASLPTSITSSPDPTTTNSQEVCSTGSFSCAAGGCCPTNMICIEINNTPGCAPAGVTSGITRVIFSSVSLRTGVTELATGSGSGVPTGGTGSNQNNGASGGNGGLSNGAIIGIGVGVGIVALGVIIVGTYLIINKRKAKATAAASAAAPGYTPQPLQPSYDPNVYYNPGMGSPAPMYSGSPVYAGQEAGGNVVGFYAPQGDMQKQQPDRYAPPPVAEMPDDPIMLANTTTMVTDSKQSGTPVKSAHQTEAAELGS